MTVVAKFYEVSATSDGVEISNMIGGAIRASGYIRQIFIKTISGGGNSFSLQMRYFSDDDSIINLICLINNGELPSYSGTEIDAPFDLKGKFTPDDLILFLKPEEDGLFKIRIDYEFDRI